MNRTLLLLISVLLLGGIAWWATTSSKPATAEERAEERRFGISDFDQVHRILIADRNGHNTTLTRGGVTGWLANGTPANENIMANLQDAIMNLDIKSLPTEKAKKNMIEDIAAHGILVQIFDENDQKLRGYYLGGGTYDETGTNAIVEGMENPYVVHLPHFTGNVRIRFSHWDDEWRDKVYFRVDPDKVERLSIEYPTQRSQSFTLTKEGRDFRLSPFYDTGQQSRIIPRGRAEGLLTRYEKYYVNRFENNDVETIKMAKEVLPFATIKVKQEGQEEQTMKVYPRYAGRTFQHHAKTGEVIEGGGLEAYTAFINDDQDWVLLNVETIQPLMVGYDAF